MNIYHLSQRENEGWDTFSDCVVVAENETEALNIHPDIGYEKEWWTQKQRFPYNSWATKPENIRVKCIGRANSDHQLRDVVCASFHARV